MNLTVTRETVSMDRHDWVNAPVTAHLNGELCAVQACSTAGLSLAPYNHLAEAIGTVLDARVSLPHGGIDVAFECDAVVEEWHEAERRLVIGFRGLRTEERDLLGRFLQHHRAQGAGDQAVSNPGKLITDHKPAASAASRSAPSKAALESTLDSLMARLSLNQRGAKPSGKPEAAVDKTAQDETDALDPAHVMAVGVGRARSQAPLSAFKPRQKIAQALPGAAGLTSFAEKSTGFARKTAGTATIAARARRAGRTLSIGSAYGLLSLAAAGYLGLASYRYMFWLDAPSSSLEAPVESIVSLGDGAVRWTQFKPGDTVKAGDVVLNVFDNVLEREIEQAAIAVREKENKVNYLQRRLDHEKLRMVGLGQMSGQKTMQISAEITGLKNKLKAANLERRQLTAATPGPLSQVRQRIVGLQQAITIKELELRGRAAVSDKTEGRMQLVGSQLIGEGDTLEAQHELAESEVALSEERHKAYLDQRDRLAVRAPFDGTLRQLTRFDNANIKRGDVAAVVEQAADRSVRAMVRQDQALRIAVGAKAEVRIPATGITLEARVAEIEPASWSNVNHSKDGENQKPGGASARSSAAEDSFTAVRLVFANPRRLDDRQAYRAGLPVAASISINSPSWLSGSWEKSHPARSSLNEYLGFASQWSLEQAKRAGVAASGMAREWQALVTDQYQQWQQRRRVQAVADKGPAG